MKREVRSNKMCSIIFFDKCTNLNEQQIDVLVMIKPPRIIVTEHNLLIKTMYGGIDGFFL